MIIQDAVFDVYSQLILKLGLSTEQSQQLHELLLERLQSNRSEAPEQMLQELLLAVGIYPQLAEIRFPQLLKSTPGSRFLLLEGSEAMLLEYLPQGKLRLQRWQGTNYQETIVRPGRLLQMLGKDPRHWLIFEPARLRHQPQRKPVQRLLEFLTLEKRALWLILIYAIVMGFLGLAVPIASQALVNNIALGSLRQPLVVLCLLLLLTLGFLTLLRSLQLLLVEMLQRRIFVRVTQDTTERLLRLESAVYEKKRLPELVNRFFDVVTVQKAASFLLLDGLAILLATLSGMVLLAFYHPLLLVFDILLLLGILLIVFVFGIGGESSSIQESGQKYAIAAWLEELATHDQLFKPAAGTRYAAWKTERLLQHYLQARHKHFKVVFRQNLGAFLLQALAATALLALGGWLVIEGQLSIGQLVAAELVVANVLNSFAKVGKHLETWYDMMAAFDKLGYLFDLPQEPSRLTLLPRTAKAVNLSMENVTYRHPHEQRQLQQLQFELGPGERVAILGANTWESDTLLDLLYGSRQPDSGLLSVDHQPLHQLLLMDYRSQVAMVRELELIPASILDNLRLAQPQLSRQQAIEVLEATGLWERVQHLPEVLDTQLAYNGFPLSLSEAHRLMLARAWLFQPRLLILDRVLDQIGWQVDGPVSHLLFAPEQRQRLSLLVVTNRRELLPHFDRVYLFAANGCLQEISQAELSRSAEA